MAEDTGNAPEVEDKGPSRAATAATETGMFLFDAFKARQNYKFQKKMQRHRDKVRRIGQSINDAAITRNAVWAEEDLRVNRLATELEALSSAGTTAVQTAVMGFSGNTSEAVSNAHQQSVDLQRKSIDRQQARLQKSENYDRLRNNWNTYTQMESVHAPVQKPDYAGMAIKSISDGMKKMAAAGGGG